MAGLATFADEIRSADEIDVFVEEYHLSELEICSISRCHAAHKHGYVVHLRSGELARIGHICGAKLLGDEAFVYMQRDLQVRQRRAQLERFIQSEQFDAVAAAAGLVAWRVKLREIGAVRALLRSDPSIYSNLLSAAQRGDSRLYRTHHEWVERVDRYGNAKRVIEGRQIRVHTMSGARWLAAQDLDGRFTHAANAIVAITQALKATSFTDNDLRRIVSQARSARDDLIYVADTVDAFDLFCSNDNVRGLQDWAHANNLDFPKLPKPKGKIDRAPIERLLPQRAHSAAYAPAEGDLTNSN